MRTSVPVSLAGKAVGPAPLAERAAVPPLLAEYPAVLFLGSPTADPPLPVEYSVALAPPGPLVVGPGRFASEVLAPFLVGRLTVVIRSAVEDRELDEARVAAAPWDS